MRKRISESLIVAALAWVVAAPQLEAQVGGFGGPSILSRGAGRIGTSGGRPIRLRGYAGASGYYSRGLTNVSTDLAGNLDNEQSLGANLSAGLMGYYQSERSNTSISGQVNYALYNKASYYSGLSQSVEFSHNRALTRRTSAFFSAVGMTSNTAGAYYPRFTEEPVAQLPLNPYQIFDARYYTVSLAAGLSYRPTARWTLSAQAGGYGYRYQSAALINSRGLIGMGTATYAVDRRTTVGVSYGYGTFFYPGQYGESKYHVAMGMFRRKLSRTWDLNLAGGAYRLYSDRITQVPLDPLIAELTGQTTGLEIYRGTTTNFSGQANLTARFRKSSLTFGYMRGVLPGNGVYLASDQESANVGYNYHGSRQWNFTAFVTGSRMKALTQNLGDSQYFGGGGSFNYLLTSYLTLNVGAGMYHTDTFNQDLNRWRFTATAGIYFSPGDVPLHIF